ncbi:MAG: class I SAM-dependent methyltransferase [Thermoleophilia bacterium]|nr:class I SAM-dependent methyltransferase [Thermoleophilia bacterium]
MERLLARLPPEPDVLELGVGAGVRSSRLLAERGRLTGVDVSAEQLARARRRLPGARLLQADLLEVEFPPRSFDAVVALYVVNHVPRDELGPLLARVATWLRPGGLFLATFGVSDTPPSQERWLGVPMLFSSYERGANDALVRGAGLEVLESETEAIEEPDGPARFHWILARRTG